MGAVDGALAAQAVGSWYASLAKPPGNPPTWLFGPVWSVLYISIGFAAWLVWRRVDGVFIRLRPLRLWGWMLLVNALWSPVFFNLRAPLPALVIAVVMLGVISLTIRAFRAVDRWAALLLVPYFLWTCYATYLNAAIWWLNGPGGKIWS